METLNLDENQNTVNMKVVKAMIDRGDKFNTIADFTGITMQELLKFYKTYYPKQYNEEIYNVMRNENISVFSEACEYLEDMAKKVDEVKGKSR